MTYSVISFLALIVHLIIQRDAIFQKNNRSGVPAQKEYRRFLFRTLSFFLVDALWGVFTSLRWVSLIYADTVLFFATMMLSVIFWTRYVIIYLDDTGIFSKILFIMVIVLGVLAFVALVINFFVPVVFWIDQSGGYHVDNARYLIYLLQIALFFLTTVYTLVVTTHSYGAVRRRHLTICLFGVSMMVMLVLQVFFEMQPMYAIGCLIGLCLLHSFIVSDEKEEYRQELEQMLQREKEHTRELGTAMRKIYTDPLTGVKSKQAYLEDGERFNRRIKAGETMAFAVAVFDVNDLKDINDTLGHDTGDIWIYTASMLITEFFAHSSVYRIGGDEFVAILEGEDYADRALMLASFDKQAEDNLRGGRVVVSSGMSEYRPNADTDFRDIFDRADKKMYLRKRRLKALRH